MRVLYTILFFLLTPLIFFRLWKKGAKLPAYRERWQERRGKVPALHSQKQVIWFHTVSVGEFIAAIPLIKHYINNDAYDVVVTTMTPTGSERVSSTFSNSVYHCYLPYDLPVFINRFLEATKPSVFVCLETELWPNLIHSVKKKNIPILLANARMSEKSAKGYRKFSALTAPMLNAISLGAIQNQEDANRLIELGLQANKTRVIGNIKFDLSIDQEIIKTAEELKSRISDKGTHKIWIAASTHLGEDEYILDAFTELKKNNPTLRLLLVPRHPERFNTVFEQCNQTGFKTSRRSENTPDNFDILLCDTMGELLMLFGTADIAFVGGSLVENGGHNYIEPAAWALPILSGPSTFNFRETAQELIDLNALEIVRDSNEIVQSIQTLINDDSLAAEKGQKAKEMADKNRGALSKLINLIDEKIQ